MTDFDELLQSEIAYHKALAEYEEAEEARARAKYEERLDKAKNAASRQSIMAQENLRRQKVALEALKEQAKADREVFSQQQEAVTDMFRGIADAAEDSYQRIEKAQNALETRLEKDADMFQDVTIRGGGDMAGEFTVLRDYGAENKKLAEYQAMLDQVKARTEGLLSRQESVDFMAEFGQMDMEEGMASAQALLRANEDFLSQYVSNWRSFHQNTESFAKDFYQADYDALAARVTVELEAAFGQVPESFWQQGKLSAQAFEEGFLEEFFRVMGNISEGLSAQISALIPDLTISGGGTQNTYNNTYHLASSYESVSDQLQAIRAAETRERLRG